MLRITELRVFAEIGNSFKFDNFSEFENKTEDNYRVEYRENEGSFVSCCCPFKLFSGLSTASGLTLSTVDFYCF